MGTNYIRMCTIKVNKVSTHVITNEQKLNLYTSKEIQEINGKLGISKHEGSVHEFNDVT